MDKLSSFLLSSLTLEQLQIIAWVLIGLALTVGMCLFFYKIQKSHLISESIKKAYTKIDLNEKIRSREDGEKEEKENKFLSKMDKKLEYSGLKKIFDWMRTEIYIAIMIGSASVSFLITLLISGSLLASLCVGAGVVTLILFITNMLMFKNYMSVENDLLNFLNLLKNYSISADEITIILYRVSKYLHDPLKTALMECYYEGKTTGNTELALIHLMNKIEHPKFKELIHNIEICGKYNADYSAILTNSRRTVQDYISARKEQKSSDRADLVTFLILFIAGGLCFIMMGNMLGISMWHELFTTTIGHVMCVYFVVLIGIFLWKNVLFNKE